MFIYLVFVFLLCDTGSCSNCESYRCNNSKQHTLCKFPTHQPALHCLNHARTIQTSNEKKALLDRINDRRNKIASGEIRSFPSAENMAKLIWNDELEKSAQRWADQCVKQIGTTDEKDSCRDLEYTSVGQNIATVYGESPGLSPQSLVDVWYMELMNTNASVILQYAYLQDSIMCGLNTWTRAEESNLLLRIDYKNWNATIKSGERLDNSENSRSRTVNRLVCNFAPSGNVLGEAVYSVGPPCSRCPYGSQCDKEFEALCNNNMNRNITKLNKIATNDSEAEGEIIIDENDNIYFDFLSRSLSTKQPATSSSSQGTSVCKDTLAIDELLELLKKRLSNDSKLKELLQNPQSSTQSGDGDSSITDPVVAFFVSKIYSKKVPITTTRTTESDYVNSTLLADLVEAVIFRSGGKTIATSDAQEITKKISYVTPIKIQASLAEVKQNYDFTGHYFFPEDIPDDTRTETVYSYEDSSGLPLSDVEFEIENLKRDKTTKDFLEDMIESELNLE